VVRRQLLQRYEHQPFVSCLAGLYGCQWRRYQRAKAQPGECCYSLIGLLVLEACAFSCRFSFGKLGFWFPWSVVLLVLAAALFTYIALLLVLAVCLLSEGQRLYLHWSHKVIKEASLHRSSSRIFVFIPYLVCVSVRQVALLSLFLAVLFALYLVPLGMYSPCIKEEGTLGPAPTLIGHRGAPMLAPENTQMSFEKAVGAGGEGLETDVTISYDGVPFLMHDRTLRRTTNIQQVFPNRTDAPAAMFTWPELEMLSAGSWFLQRDPFGTVSSLDADERVRVQNQTVPSLKDLLNLAAQHERLVIFDLRRPPLSLINRILYAGGHSQRVLWLPADQRSLVQELDPELQQMSGDHASIEELQEEHIVRLNLHYSYMSQEQIRKYASVNISTNLYVISQPWLYSLAWCAGVHSVTTNALHKLKMLQRPLFLMTPDEYSLMWILTDILSAFLILIQWRFSATLINKY
uniref:Glycerophosphodiester phosphodiesterase domain containing 4a n=1 Tax=Sinocyclocheilus anshuiensis TaxID=1608454 RepID=A0A671SXQ4_9TELE